jgi:hypothetical protein
MRWDVAQGMRDAGCGGRGCACSLTFLLACDLLMLACLLLFAVIAVSLRAGLHVVSCRVISCVVCCGQHGISQSRYLGALHRNNSTHGPWCVVNPAVDWTGLDWTGIYLALASVGEGKREPSVGFVCVVWFSLSLVVSGRWSESVRYLSLCICLGFYL